MTNIQVNDLIPVTEYDGGVYEQTVVADLDHEHSLSLFDGSTLLTDDDIGTTYDVALIGRMVGGQQDIDARGIWRPTDPSTEWSYMLGGTIRSVDTEGHLLNGYEVIFEFDVGSCSLLVKPDGERRAELLDGELVEGADIVVEVSRIDLVSVKR